MTSGLHLKNSVELFRAQMDDELLFLFEHPDTATSHNEDVLNEFINDPNGPRVNACEDHDHDHHHCKH